MAKLEIKMTILESKKETLIKANVEMKYNPEAKGGEESGFT